MFDPSKFTVSKPKPLPVIFLIDVSGSMGEIIDETDMRETGQTVFVDGRVWNLVEGGISRIQLCNKCCAKMLESFSDSERNNIEIDVAIITFGSTVQIHTPLTSASEIVWQELQQTDGDTPLGEALKIAKNMIENKSIVPSRAYRPAVILVTDGRPNDNWEEALNLFVSEGRSSKCDRIALGIGRDFDESVLSKFIEGTNRTIFKADEAEQIQEFFKYVTMSVTTRSLSKNPNVISASLDGKTVSQANDAADDEESYF